MVGFLLIRSKSSTVKFFEIQMPENLQNLWRSKEKCNTSKEFHWNVGLKNMCDFSGRLTETKQAWKSYAKTFYQTMPERITQRCGLLKQNLPAPWANKAAADEGSSVVCDTSMLLSIAGSEKVSEFAIIFFLHQKWAIFQLYHGENKLNFDEMMILMSALYLTNMVNWSFYSASSLKQQSVDRHVAPLRHILLIPNQPVFALTLWCSMLSRKAAITKT